MSQRVYILLLPARYVLLSRVGCGHIGDTCIVKMLNFIFKNSILLLGIHVGQANNRVMMSKEFDNPETVVIQDKGKGCQRLRELRKILYYIQKEMILRKTK